MALIRLILTERVYSNNGNKPILDEIKGNNLNILDIGCGAGDNAAFLTLQGHTVDGITYSPAEAKQCKGRMRRVIVHDLEQGLPTTLQSPYDYIICSHVLEHLSKPDAILQQAKALLTPKGIVLIALPNLMHYSSRWKLLLGNFDYRETGVWDNTHLRWFTYSSGKRLLEAAGYEVTKSWVEGAIPALRIFGFIPEPVRRTIYKGLIAVSKGLFAGQLLYAATVKN